ncbi:hypothetical protein F2Q69_00028783 [Brassica cretica]|uniref:Retrotransposon gag domain-containing protein n=1 Tax=Brassica cretica TaxID=69181 RepID=A0A8S9RVC5_BRACR|nr:hypothetical protein F2Q69_00028783 [Brassica cretica]
MMVDEHNEPSDDAQRVAELQKQVDGMQSQITEMNRTREATGENPNLSSEVQSLKEKLDEHSKQLEQSAEKLSQLLSENTVLQDQNQARSMGGNKKHRFNTQLLGSGVAEATHEGAENPQVHSLEESDSEPESDKETPEKKSATGYSMTAYLEKMFSKRFDAMQSMVERLPGVAPPIRRSNLDSYADTPFVEGIASVEMPKKFSFPSIKMYDWTGDPDDHIAQYKQRMLAVALPKESREATMCKGFGSILIGPALQWYINLPTRSISSFTILNDKFVEQFASSRSLEKTSDGLYEILQHRGPTSRWGPLQRTNHVSLQDHGRRVIQGLGASEVGEDVASCAKAQPKFQNRPLEKEEGMSVSTWPDISHLLISAPELVNVLRQMGQQVKWRQKMKAPDSFWNPGLWCDFHHDHGHKTEDCVALRIKVNELLQKGHLLEFLSEKAKNHLNKKVPAKSAGAIPDSPPRQDQVIHVITGGLEISGVSHAAAKKCTRNAKHGMETTKPKRFLLGTDEISFTAKEKERILAPHHDALVISLTVANCLVKRILVDNDHSKGKNQGLIAITVETSDHANSGTRGLEDRRMAIVSEDADLESREGPPKDRCRPLRMVSLKVFQSGTCSEDMDLARSSSSTPQRSHQLSTNGLADEQARHEHREETSPKIIPDGSGAECTLPTENKDI